MRGERAASQKRWHKTSIHECACGFGEAFLKVSFDEDWGVPDQPEWHVEIIRVGSPRWRDRIRLAWRVIRGLEYQHTGILIDRVDAAELSEFLRKEADHE